MDASDYTEPFELIRLEQEIDDEGIQHENSETVFKGFAKVVNISGSEFWAASAIGAQNTIKVSTRWNKRFEALDIRSHVLVIRGRRFDITAADNISWRNEGCTFKAKERIHG